MPNLHTVGSVEWTELFKNKIINFNSQYQVVPTEGYLAWEYNPLRNYRLNQNMYEKDGKYYTQDEYKKLTGKSLSSDIKQLPEGWSLREAGELVDFITDELSFNINHPVDILPQYSYDGSVNLIINDGLNIPRLINSRFTVTGKNTYKIIDRKGDNDTNIYDQGTQFDIDTSLFKNVTKIPKLEYLGTSGGNLSIGNYHFYFKYADADGNESDWVAESGLVSVFMGESPMSVNTGIRDENSIKSVKFQLSNIDIGYSYVKVYYTRYSADVDGNLTVQAKRIDKNFIISSQGTCPIIVDGNENTTDVALDEINSSFDSIQNSKTQCTAANRLFMANVHKTRIEYDRLSKLSLCFCPYKYEEDYPLTVDDSINQDYEISSISDGYYDTKYIYDKTGYWPGDLYRIGIVYILKDGSLSPVFNIRGATNIPTAVDYNGNRIHHYKIEQDLEKEFSNFDDVLDSVQYAEETYAITGGIATNENAKGVIQFNYNTYNTTKPFPVIGINIKAHPAVINDLKNYAKGFFFVRQKRMPLTMCQGLVIGLDRESRTPTLPTLGGVLQNVTFDKSFIVSKDINDINYISEGFLGRYYFKFNKKKIGFWKKFGIMTAVVAVLAAAVVASVFTCGAAGVALGVTLASSVSVLGVTGLAGVAVATGLAAAATVVSLGIAGAIEAAVVSVRQERNKGAVQAIDGRHDPIPDGYTRGESDDSRKLVHDISERYIVKDPTKNTDEALIVPDYQVNQPYYNQLFTGDNFTVKLTREQPQYSYLNDGYLISDYRHFYTGQYKAQSDFRNYNVKLVGVPDGCPIKMIGENKYRARAGYPEEAYKYEFQGESYDDTTDKIDNSDIIRGNYGSYVGMSQYRGHACDQVDIMIPGYQENNLHDYIQLRAQDTSAFFAISDRVDVQEINKKTSLLVQAEDAQEEYSINVFRGDCYICQFSHRIVRNFNDPSAPYNDKIVDPKCWRDNYNPDEPEKYADINLGDVNAVQMGLWLTFQLRSSYNLNIRTIDKSHIDEYLMCGNYRSFYPHYGQLADGNQKIPDSDQYNKGFSKSVSEKYYFEVPDVPYIKQEFQNRIVFSDIHINDAYKNGFRVLRTTNHKDYPMTYGSITKILELQNTLLVVFEHGIGLIKIDNTAEQPSRVLSDLTIISDAYGSQWKDSIIKTPSGIYGVDTVAKKIWRVRGGQIELISDTKVQEFLNQNISLSERELTPIIGIRNVKTVYNAFKHDVMFTFYDNLQGLSEKSWNLCWNEILGVFTTFYSWIPSEMVNIDNIPFSFDRTTVKAISKLGISDHGNDFSDGITLTNNLLKVSKTQQGNTYLYSFKVDNSSYTRTYLDNKGNVCEYIFKQKSGSIPTGCTTIDTITGTRNFIGFLNIDNRMLPDGKVHYEIEYELLRDRQKNHELFDIVHADVAVQRVNTRYESNVQSIKVAYLKLNDYVNVENLLSELYYRNNEGHSYADINDNKVDAEVVKDALGNVTGFDVKLGLPIFKNLAGKRLMLEEEKQLNPDKLIRYLNIRANISIIPDTTETQKASEAYYNQFVQKGGLIDAGYFESQVALTTDHNLSQLSSDFWKHGQAGIIDITDKIYPTYWYGKQHPFEFECVVVDDPTTHKIFTNLELVSNKVKPESFHYEVVGDTYDFAEDKPTMYFRQEALKALYQYNGYDIEYNPNFVEIEPKQHARSAIFPQYYSRWDTVNEIYDSYKRLEVDKPFNYDHLSGSEIVYYPTRNEFRVWNHAQAIDVDSLNQDLATSVIKANCRYLEDKWLVTINPIVVTYKNEFNTASVENGKSLFFQEDGKYKYSTWVPRHNSTGEELPPIIIKGTKFDSITSSDSISFPGDNKYIPNEGNDNSLYELYNLNAWKQGDWKPIDPSPLNERHEADVRGKFMKVRIRYSGEDLAIIDLLNTIYQISFA